MKKNILFILRFGDYAYGRFPSSGLFNSVQFVVQMLRQAGFTANSVQVIDNNGIDAAVTKFKPDVVVIEALWVVPSKFDVLKRLHPNVKWIVRLHSDMPFLAQEGVAMEWLIGYFKRGIIVAGNSQESFREITDVSVTTALPGTVWYLPNFYPVPPAPAGLLPAWLLGPKASASMAVINVGCFGAIRPLKNQLIQGAAALKFGHDHKKTIHFHVNSGRIESGAPVLKNLRSLYGNTPWGTLVEHPWMDRKDFLALLKTMDVSLCVSLSETFCIVAADSVAEGVPLVSANVPWAVSGVVNPTNITAITNAIFEALISPNVEDNLESLTKYSASARSQWIGQLRRL